MLDLHRFITLYLSLKLYSLETSITDYFNGQTITLNPKNRVHKRATGESLKLLDCSVVFGKTLGSGWQSN